MFYLAIFQEHSITDSGMGSMNKSHSNLDSKKNSLRERNTFENKSLSANLSYRHKPSKQSTEFSSEILKPEFPNDSSQKSINISQSDDRGFLSSLANAIPTSSYSMSSRRPTNDSLVSMAANTDTCHRDTASSRPTGNCQPLNARRLRPIRQKTRNAILNILIDETVCLEFLKYPTDANGNDAMMKITEVMCIDPLGQSILVYSPQRFVPQDIDTPTQLESGDRVSHFLLATMPDKYAKKYELAKRLADGCTRFLIGWPLLALSNSVHVDELRLLLSSFGWNHRLEYSQISIPSRLRQGVHWVSLIE